MIKHPKYDPDFDRLVGYDEEELLTFDIVDHLASSIALAQLPDQQAPPPRSSTISPSKSALRPVSVAPVPPLSEAARADL